MHSTEYTVTFENDGIREKVAIHRVARAPTTDITTRPLEEQVEVCTELEKVYDQQPILVLKVSGQTVSRNESFAEMKNHFIDRINTITSKTKRTMVRLH